MRILTNTTSPYARIARIALAESLLILPWLERKISRPSLLEDSLDVIISKVGCAMGVIDAMVHIICGAHHDRCARLSAPARHERAQVAERPAYSSTVPYIA